MVLEDVQWADEASLEVLRVVGRRTTQLPALVIATVRDDEIGPDHPLSVAVGDIPAASTVSVVLPPLSPDAVAQLVAGTALDPSVLYDTTAGNPFFVIEHRPTFAPSGVCTCERRQRVGDDREE